MPTSIASSIRFQNESERSYFRLFQDEVAGSFSGGLDATLWNCIALSACDDPGIKGLAITFTALKKATSTNNLLSLSSKVYKSMHRKYALNQYGKALNVNLTNGEDINGSGTGFKGRPACCSPYFLFWKYSWGFS